MSDASPSRAIIDLRAYDHNLDMVRNLIPSDCAIMAVVKAEAYGHGLVPMARRAVASGVAMLGVATVDEGVALREAGIDAPVLVLVQPGEDALPLAVEHDLQLMISDVAAAERLGQVARKANKVLPIHCKIDTGMGRQGFEVDHAIADLVFITRISNVDIEGIATHFPAADLKDDPFTLNQIKVFRRLMKQLGKKGVPFEVAHAANSAAILNYADGCLSMVRPGLMTYGVWPTAPPAGSSVLRPVLRWETRVVLLKQLEAGATVGYGRTYATAKPMRAAILPVGYADGYKHRLSNKADVLIRGRRCPVRGSVNMDQIVVDVGAAGDVAAGDTATLIGSDGNETITVEELAQHAGTIPYDILVGIGPRVHREYKE